MTIAQQDKHVSSMNYKLIGLASAIFITLLVSAFYIYYGQVMLSIKSLQHDIYFHATFFSREGYFNMPPGVYFLTALFSFFSKNEVIETYALVILLIVSKLFLYWLNVRYFQTAISAPIHFIHILALFAVISVPLSLPFSGIHTDISITPIRQYFTNMYAHLIGTNNWHNSTVILTLPLAFSIWVFQLNRKDTLKHILLQSGLLFAICLIKPSFLMAYVPAVFLLFAITLLPLRLPKHLALSAKSFAKRTLLFAGIIGIAGVILNYALIYVFQMRYAPNESNSLAISPFEVYQYFTGGIQYIPVSLLASVLLPASIVISLGWQKSMEDADFVLACTMFIIGVLIYLLMAENGMRKFHANFKWQAEIANYLLMVTTLRLWLKHRWQTPNLKEQIHKFGFGDYVVISLIVLQGLNGAVYLLRYIYQLHQGGIGYL